MILSQCLQLIAGTAQDFPLMKFYQRDTAQITGFGVMTIHSDSFLETVRRELGSPLRYFLGRVVSSAVQVSKDAIITDGIGCYKVLIPHSAEIAAVVLKS